MGDTNTWCEFSPVKPQVFRGGCSGMEQTNDFGGSELATQGLGWRERRSNSRMYMCSPVHAAKYNQWDRCSKTGSCLCPEEAEGSPKA